jgi:uncharacterized SAM-dependent methyltransferase
MARFNRNALFRLMRDYGAQIRPADWSHGVRYDPTVHRIELTLESPSSHRVSIPGLDLDLGISKGERLLTAISRKFDHDELVEWFEARGLNHRASWTDEHSWIELLLLERA